MHRVERQRHTLLLGATDLLDLSQGWVKVQGPQSVTDVESIHGFISFEVVDGEGERSP